MFKLLVTLIVYFICSNILFAQKITYNSEKTVLTTSVKPVNIKISSLKPYAPFRGGLEIAEPSEHMIEIGKSRGVSEPPYNSPYIFSDLEADVSSSNFSVVSHLVNIRMTDLVPADPSIACGKDNIVLLNNDGFYVFNKTDMTLVYNNDFGNFFSENLNFFDPKIIYDKFSSKWIFVILAKNNQFSRSYAYLAVSENSDPLGDWYYYVFDETLDGNKISKNWADYPFLSVSSDINNDKEGLIVISTNQFKHSFYGNIYQYSKLRVFDKRIILEAKPVDSWNDIWDINDKNGDYVGSMNVPTMLSASDNAEIYFMNTSGYSGDKIYLWRLYKNNKNELAIEFKNDFKVFSYLVPPFCPVKLSRDEMFTLDCRIYSLSFFNNTLYGCYHSSYVWNSKENSIVNYIKVNTATGLLDVQTQIGKPGYWYVFPSVIPVCSDAAIGDSAIISFNRGGPDIYPEARFALHFGNTSANWLGSYLIQEGKPSAYPYTRLGDYSSIVPDFFEQNTYWSANMVSDSSSWSVSIGSIKLK